jgi:AcrR family transcriptional regulator
LRADAQRNRDRILRAAEAVLATKGSGVGVDDIAAEAGLGIGTLYRHFPTKEALYHAIMVVRFRRLVADAEVLLSGDDPEKGLFLFLSHVVDEARVKRDLADTLAAWVDPTAVPGGEVLEVANQLIEVTGRLLSAAQVAGRVRADVGPADLLGLVMGPCLATENPLIRDCSPQLMLEVVCAGLRSEQPPAG